MDLGSREQRRDHFERRIFRGGANQDNVAALDVRQKRVLLGFVEAVDFVDEQHRAAAHPAEAFGVRHHRLDLFYAGQHRAERHELAACDARDQARERSLANARRPPQDQRAQLIALDLRPQRLARRQDVLLSYKVLEFFRTHALGERPFRVVYRWKRRGIEQAHGSVLWRRASYNITPAATAAFSDSTPEAGILTPVARA
jgi:hypothetical protein